MIIQLDHRIRTFLNDDFSFIVVGMNDKYVCAKNYYEGDFQGLWMLPLNDLNKYYYSTEAFNLYGDQWQWYECTIINNRGGNDDIPISNDEWNELWNSIVNIACKKMHIFQW